MQSDLTLNEVATLLNCSYWHARKLVLSGTLKAYNIGLGKHWDYRIQLSELEDFRARRAVASPAKTFSQPIARRRYIPQIVKL